MSYTVQKLATLAGISVRTLHYYDQVGLLKPSRVENNGYRYYEERELLKLQQILFFRELDFPLDEIRRILSSQSFDMRDALRDQRKLIELKKNRLNKLVKTIDKTIKKINKEITMDDKELYGNFSKEEMEKYTEEARQKWGDTTAFKQSEVRVKKMGKDGLKKVLEIAGKLTVEIAKTMKAGLDPKSTEVQKLIAQHYDGLRAFYEPNLELYRGLASMYVADERFKANYENVAPGLAQFMHDAMITYCDEQESKK
jgi:DNA-binding transcriptional MerR regulator